MSNLCSTLSLIRSNLCCDLRPRTDHRRPSVGTAKSNGMNDEIFVRGRVHRNRCPKWLELCSESSLMLLVRMLRPPSTERSPELSCEKPLERFPKSHGSCGQKIS